MDGQPVTPPPGRKHWYERPKVVIPLAILVILAGFFLREVLIQFTKIKSGEIPLDFSSDVTRDPNVSGSGLAGERLTGGFDRADAPSLGGRDAKVVIVEFGDFECPFSQQAFPSVRGLATAYGDRVRFVWRDFPISVLHENAEKAAEAGRCAFELGGNDKFWQLHDQIFLNQENLSVESLKQLGQRIGLNSGQFNSCLDSGRHRLAVQSDYLAGQTLGIPGTPTFFLNGLRVPGAIPEDIFKLLIDRELTLAGG